jgi:hypothetical protein
VRRDKDADHEEIGGGDAEEAAGVEVTEVVRLGAAVEQDSGDEEAGEDEEEMDTHVAEAGDVFEAEQEARGVEQVGGLVGREAVVEQDHEDGNAAGDV